jgi:hypothetical protein
LLLSLLLFDKAMPSLSAICTGAVGTVFMYYFVIITDDHLCLCQECMSLVVIFRDDIHKRRMMRHALDLIKHAIIPQWDIDTAARVNIT